MAGGRGRGGDGKDSWMFLWVKVFVIKLDDMRLIFGMVEKRIY